MPRHGFDGAKLGEDVARLAAADKASPPAARPSLMEAVRALAPFIETRTRLNWGDPKIAAVLSAAGYPIDAATLRSYRKRLRDEGLLPPLKANTPKQPISDTAPVRSEVGVVQSTPSIAKPEVEGTMSRAPPESAPTPTPTPTPTSGSTRRFSINPAKRPLDRA